MADSEQGCCDLNCWNRRTKADKLCAVGLILGLTLAIIALLLTITVYQIGLINTCRNTECVQQASRTMAMMDRSMNPCEDFYQYACGGYLSDESTRDKNVYIEQINKLNDLVKVILTENVKYGDPRFLSFPKMLYKSCMDQDKINRDGIKPFTEYINQFGGWPTTLSKWNEKNFNWVVLVRQFREIGLPFRYLIEVADIEDEGAKLLFRAGAINSELISEQKRNEDVICSYQKKLVDIAKKFGAESNRAEEDMKAVVDFEISLARISEFNNTVERTTIENLEKRYPFMSWLTFIRSSFGLNVCSSEVVLIVPAYIERLGVLLQTTPQRVIANYMMAKLHLFLVELLPKSFIYDCEFQPYEERQKLCIDLIRTNLWVAMAALYQQKYFDEQKTEGVKKMLKLLEREFEFTILRANWMNNASKEIALKKLKTMEVHIGFPTEMMDIKKLDNFHGDLGGQSTHRPTWRWITDFITGAIISFRRTHHIVSDMTDNEERIAFDRTIQEPKEPIDMSANVKNRIAKEVKHRNTVNKYNLRNMGIDGKWLGVSDQIQMRAKYVPQYNMLDVRAGILRGGFYHNRLPYYVNFGALGAILAHELVHSIDNKGRSYDEFGNLRHLWREYSRKIFEHKFQCVINQYDSFVEPLTGRKLNGTATLDENIADNIGLAIAYKAYSDWVKQYGRDPSLPGLNLTGYQLFWVSNAQTQCSNPSVDKVAKQIDQSDFSPERFRVIGSISNNRHFANDFQCPLGSPMNPTNKCKFS